MRELYQTVIVPALRAPRTIFGSTGGPRRCAVRSWPLSGN
jgi:hypothetical protein